MFPQEFPLKLLFVHRPDRNTDPLFFRQIKDLLEESAKQKLELSECKREIFKLQQRK